MSEKVMNAPVRRRPKKIVQDEDDDEDDNNPKKNKINWMAVFFLMLFVIPVLMTAAMTAIDYLYPDAARMRQLRQRVTKCYSAANPKKLSEVDYIMEKYKGKEYVLFAQNDYLEQERFGEAGDESKSPILPLLVQQINAGNVYTFELNRLM
eukprot:gene6418-12976_t